MPQVLQSRPILDAPCRHVGLWRADITADWLRSFAPPPLVVTCLNVFEEFIKEACAEAGAENIQFNIGLHCDREKRFFEVRDQVKHALDEGRDVVLHCQSGIRRAPLSFICMLMHLAPKSFEQSKQVCEQIRSRAPVALPKAPLLGKSHALDAIVGKDSSRDTLLQVGASFAIQVRSKSNLLMLI